MHWGYLNSALGEGGDSMICVGDIVSELWVFHNNTDILQNALIIP